MPQLVDLSTPGFLQGQQMYADRMQTAAQTKLQDQQAREKDLENTETEGVNAVLQEHGEFLRNKLSGTATPGGELDLGVSDEQAASDPFAGSKRLAEKLSAAGYAHKALEISDKITEQEKRVADIEKGGIEAQGKRLDNIVKGAEMFGRYFGDVKNDDELQARIAEVRSINQRAGEEIIPENMLGFLEETGYEPNTLGYLTSTALSHKDRATMERQALTDDQLAKYRQAAMDNAESRLVLAQNAQDSLERHRIAVEKAAGKKGAANTPSKERREAANRALRNSVFKDVGKKDLQVETASDYVANAATSILAENDALTEDEAIQQAILMGQKDGVFQVHTEQNLLFGVTKTPTFKPGTTPDNASPIPKDPSGMKKGHYYTAIDPETRRPILVQWDGQNAVEVTEGAPKKKESSKGAAARADRARAAL